MRSDKVRFKREFDAWQFHGNCEYRWFTSLPSLTALALLSFQFSLAKESAVLALKDSQ